MGEFVQFIMVRLIRCPVRGKMDYSKTRLVRFSDPHCTLNGDKANFSILPLEFLVSFFQLCVEVVDLRDLALELGLELLQVVGKL